MKLEFNRVLALAPHADDVEVWAGGLIRRLLRQGSDVHLVHLAGRDEPRVALRREVAAAAGQLRADLPGRLYVSDRFDRLANLAFRDRWPVLKEVVGEQFARVAPDLVVVPARGDRHEDHAATREAALIAAEQTPALVLGFVPTNRAEIASPHVLVAIDEVDIAAASRAARCYSAVIGTAYGAEDFARCRAALYGSAARSPYAEPYTVERWVLR